MRVFGEEERLNCFIAVYQKKKRHSEEIWCGLFNGRSVLGSELSLRTKRRLIKIGVPKECVQDSVIVTRLSGSMKGLPEGFPKICHVLSYWDANGKRWCPSPTAQEAKYNFSDKSGRYALLRVWRNQEDEYPELKAVPPPLPVPLETSEDDLEIEI